jgi:hypothetical protein
MAKSPGMMTKKRSASGVLSPPAPEVPSTRPQTTKPGIFELGLAAKM